MRIVQTLLLLVSSVSACGADTFKCVDATGRPRYTNIESDTIGKNCSKVMREIAVPDTSQPRSRAAATPSVTSLKNESEWIKMGENDAIVFYANSNIRAKHIDDGSRMMWSLHDAKTSGGYLSAKALNEYDCKGGRYRTLYVISYAGHMATGETRESGTPPQEWFSAPADSVANKQLRFACHK